MKSENLQCKWVSANEYNFIIKGGVKNDLTVYHGLEWLNAISNGFNTKIKYLSVALNGGGVLAVLPCMFRSQFGIRIIGSPLSGLYTEFCGPLFLSCCSDEWVNPVIDKLHCFLSANFYYIEYGSQGRQMWGNRLEEKGYKFLQRPTLSVELGEGTDKVWSSFEGRARNMVRKAEKIGVIVTTTIPDERWVIEYYDVLKTTFAKQGIMPPHPLRFYLQIIDLARAGIAKCYSAEKGGAMVAGSVFVYDRKRMLYLSGAANEEGMACAATSLLQWEAMKHAITAGATVYDMGGTGVPSIDRFKRSFGGKDDFHSRWMYRNNLFRILEPIGRWAYTNSFLRKHLG